MSAKRIDRPHQSEPDETSRGKKPKAPPTVLLDDVPRSANGQPVGGQGRVDLTGIMPGGVRIDPFLTEGHAGYDESGQSEIIPPVEVAGEMKVMDAIYTRRSVRDYTDREVSKETVMLLLQAAIQAPSAVNEQPWTFVVIQEKLLLRRYSDNAKQLFAKNVKLDSLHADLKKAISDPAFNIFHNAGTLIVICAKPIGQHPAWDCCFAAENLMLAAHAMGLATCPIGFAWSLLDDLAIRRELQIPSEYVPVLPIIVGYSRKPVAPVSRKESVILCWK
jgi:nitroreductase